MTRHTYAYGYKTYAEALEALSDMHAACEVSLASKPQISAYATHHLTEGHRVTRYRITLDE